MVSEATEIVAEISSGVAPALREKSTPATVPEAVVSMKLASVAAVPATEILSPVPVAEMVMVSVVSSPEMVTPAPAAKFRVSVEESATGSVPEGALKVEKRFWISLVAEVSATEISMVSVPELPVMVTPVPAVKVRVSELMSVTGLVPEGVAMVLKMNWEEPKSVLAMVMESAPESPVTDTPVPAEMVKVSAVVSATGDVPEVVEIVWKMSWSPVLVPERVAWQPDITPPVFRQRMALLSVVPRVPTVMEPSVVRLARPAPVLVRAKVVLAPSTKSKVVMPEAVLEMVESVPAMTRVLEAESKVKAPAAPEERVTAPAPV